MINLAHDPNKLISFEFSFFINKGCMYSIRGRVIEREGESEKNAPDPARFSFQCGKPRLSCY